MSFNNILLNSLKNQTIDLKNNEQVNLYFVDFSNDNFVKKLEINLFNNNNVNLFGICVNNGHGKYCEININHNGSNSKSKIFFKAFNKNKAMTSIICNSKAKEKTLNNAIDQDIGGLLLDNNSSITALPCLDVDTNSIIAEHSVNIGQIDPEIVFYLNSKGLSVQEAYLLVIDSFVNNFSVNEAIDNQLHANLKQSISKILRG